MSTDRPTTKTVEQIGKINLSGNIIPLSWFQVPELKTEKGQTYLLAINLLSDLCYWYRPEEVIDEETGLLKGYRRKFPEDRLRMFYDFWALKFGVTKRMIQDAVAHLKKKGLITVEYRTIDYKGSRLNNVPYPEPVPALVRDITYPVTYKRETLSQINGGPSHVKTGEPVPDKRETKKETTEETTQETTKPSPAPSGTGQGSPYRVKVKRKPIDPALRPYQQKMLGHQAQVLGKIPDPETQAGAARWILEANHGGTPERTFEIAIKCFEKYRTDKSIKFFKGWSSVRGYIGAFASKNGLAPSQNGDGWKREFIDKLATCSSQAQTQEERETLRSIHDAILAEGAERQAVKNLLWESWVADRGDLIQLFADPIKL